MDPALLREREAFKKKAMQLPTVEKRKAKEQDIKNKPAPSKPAKRPKPEFDYKSATGSSNYRFGILAKIVKHMKTRHQQGDNYTLTVDEILDETNQADVPVRQKHWLVTEALINNPKIEVIDGDRFKYKPKYNIRNRKGLLNLLDKMDQKGQGGILYEDIEEALPKAEKAMEILGDSVLVVKRPDKKKVVFYNDKTSLLTVDDELKKLWRSVAVDGMDERKIEDYLDKQGITSMEDVGVKKAVPKRKNPGSRKGQRSFKKHNDHLGDILQDYSKP